MNDSLLISSNHSSQQSPNFWQRLSVAGCRCFGCLSAFRRIQVDLAEIAISPWVFLRVLGIIHLIAFASLWRQIAGLIGHEGILPASHLLQAAGQQLGPERYRLLPTLCWINSSDAFLFTLCGLGAVLSVLLIFDVAPAIILLLLWSLYLSLTTVCRDFLAFQWDNLLLEVSFLSVWLAPWRLRPRIKVNGPPPALALWLCWWLLFRLVFSSGAVKLASGDPTWRTLTALFFHYETQPLPVWTSWYVHHLPEWFHRSSCAGMFLIELAVPFLIFGPRMYRRLAAGALMFLQVLIAATGNYAFFNFLTIALCLLLLDDLVWPRWMRERLITGVAPTPPHLSVWRRWMMRLAAMVVLLMSGMQLAGLLVRRPIPWPKPIVWIERQLLPLRTVNSYGLFAVMTTSRLEIILEGSNDGTTWSSYEFKHKPGDPMKRPEFIAPHQPRLDWQMWFAALSSYQDHPWFLPFCTRVLEGSTDVLALLANNPFPDAPPRYLRAVVYDYHFTGAPAHRSSGAWWRRERKGLYCPVLSLRNREGEERAIPGSHRP